MKNMGYFFSREMYMGIKIGTGGSWQYYKSWNIREWEFLQTTRLKKNLYNKLSNEHNHSLKKKENKIKCCFMDFLHLYNGPRSKFAFQLLIIFVLEEG